MTVVQSKSPEGHEFAPRRPTFDLKEILSRDWHGGSAFRTAWFNALSTMFPIGEKFFIDSVRAFKDEVDDPQLKQEITAFQGQEAVHRLEHQRYNEMLCEARGYDLGYIEDRLRVRLDWARRELPPRRQLAGTVAYEHLTAIMADDMLAHPDVLAGADPEIARLWRWHGIEETEHKSVAFDVHELVGGTVRERRVALMFNTFYFFKDAIGITRYMLRSDGHRWAIREWLSGLNFLFGKPGIMRRCFFSYLSFYRKRFHPWNDDNRHLIEAWQNEQDAAGQA